MRDPKALLKASIASSAGAFLFSILITIAPLAILLGVISIVSGVLALRKGSGKAAYVSIAFSSLWVLYAVIFTIIRSRELGIIP